MSRSRAVRKSMLLVLCMLMLGNGLFAQQFRQRLSWKADKNVLEYKVELEPEEGGQPTVLMTEDNFVELSLAPGAYRYKIHAYDFLGREATSTEWIRFEVLKANRPEIERPEDTLELSSDTDELVMQIEIADVTDDSVVELVSENGRKTIKGELVFDSEATDGETNTVQTVRFKNAAAGQWKIRVTNPSGLSSETGLFELKPQQLAKSTRKKDKSSSKTADKEQSDAEPEAEAEPDAAPEENAAEDELPTAITMTSDDTKEKRPREKREPVLTLSVGIGLTVPQPVADGGLGLYEYNSGLLFRPQAQITLLPIKLGKTKLGLEVGAGMNMLRKTTSEYYEAEFDIYSFTAPFVFRHRLFADVLNYQLKAGPSFSLINKRITYTKNYTQQPEETLYLYPGLYGALSFVVAAGNVSFEFGADMIYFLIGQQLQSLTVTPYIAIGVAF